MRLTILLACLFTSLPLAAQIPLEVDTAQGRLRGAAVDEQVRSWRGIPFAAPPVGENRWRAPQPVSPWQDVRDATGFGARCMQGGALPAGLAIDTSEDCLYLNVWSAAQTVDDLRPVIVWIHGGGFTGGTGADPRYDGAALARQGAVVVTFNYRLGPFGFFAHPALSAESGEGSGNYAMRDMIAVLEWVYENIAAFGGDPINVSVVGESAGAQAVATLLGSPRAAGLFHRAVMQSGGWMGLGMGRLATASEREAAGAEQAGALGATTLDALRNLPADAVQTGMPSGRIGIDGYVLARDPSLIWDAGQQQPVDVLAGSNANEAVFFGPGLQTAAELRDYAREHYGALADDFLALYPAGSDEEANRSYLRAFSDELAWQMRRLALYQGQRGLGAYVYHFTRVPPGQEARGATHVAELPYMFNQAALNPAWTDTDRSLSDTMARYWVRFAASTNPNTQGLPAWPAYRSHDIGNVMVLGDNVAVETTPVPSPDAMAFFDRAHARLLAELAE